MWWGYSSALDLLEECDLKDRISCSGDGTSPVIESNEVSLNVLLVGQFDNRHVLNTLAKKYKHEEKVKMNLYICESLLENVARDLLFLFLALEPPENLGLADKTRIFMELYGNTLVRPAASNYLSAAAHQLLLLVTDADYSQKLLPFLSLNRLKYKDRDQLEIIFKYWSSTTESFDVLTSWDQRLRKALGMRYDTKDGVFDWDYHMRYRTFGAGTLHMQEYKRFRERGMSYYFEDTDPCVPNRTLASAIISAGSRIINCGYLGDIVTGPYPTFGFDCEDSSMLAKVNGYAKKTATDVTENNVMRIFHELLHREPFQREPSEDESVPVVTVDTSDRLTIKSLPESAEALPRKINAQRNDYRLLSVEDCQIIFLPTTALKDYANKAEFENFFDLVTIPQVMVLKHFTPDVAKLLKPNCKILVDTPKYLLGYRNEDLEKYKCDVDNLMKDAGCKALTPSFDYASDEFMRFRIIK